MAKDRLGNKLEAGDVVQLALGPHLLLGRVVDIKLGGISRVSGMKGPNNVQAHVTPQEVTVVFDYSAFSSPDNQPVQGLLPVSAELTKIVDPGNLKGVCSKDWWEGFKATGSKFVVN